MSTDEADAPDDEVSIGAAMGGTEQDQDTTHVPEADRMSYEDAVARAAEFLQQGLMDVSQVKPKQYHDVSEDQFFADVQDKLNEGSEGNETAETAIETDPNSVDWDALWEEFGFDSPGPDGHKYISTTQLRTALECTDQACPSGMPTISQAADDGELHKVTAAGEGGMTATLGYVRTPGGDSR